MKRIASFPDAFQFSGTFRDAWGQIGNSVPPLFMKAIAEHVRNILK
jgi:DNA (cytosine-5)-methyltransferase 1